MFKSVEYAGFDGNPELKVKAERANAVLAVAVGERQGEVEVRWSPAADAAGVLELTLRRTLRNGVEGEFTGTFVPDDFISPRWLRLRCLQAWDDLLGVLLDRQHERVQEFFLEPTEA